MAREWRSDGTWNGYGGGIVLILWAALLSTSLLLAVLVSCADGATRDKDSTTYTTAAAACGAGCGGGCGG